MKILKTIELKPFHVPTGKTRHYHGGLLPAPSSLRIGQYPGRTGFYLFYLDKDGRELTDTYHSTLSEAMSQAEFEFLVKPEEWTDVVVSRYE